MLPMTSRLVLLPLLLVSGKLVLGGAEEHHGILLGLDGHDRGLDGHGGHHHPPIKGKYA